MCANPLIIVGHFYASNPKIWGEGSKFICLHFVLLYAECQMPFNTRCNGCLVNYLLKLSKSGQGHYTSYNLKPQGSKYRCFYAPNQQLSQLTSPVTATTASILRYSTLVQAVLYTPSKFQPQIQPSDFPHQPQKIIGHCKI